MSILSVITLMDRITAHAALDTLEMEHHAPVNHKLYPVHLTLYDLLDTKPPINRVLLTLAVI